MPSKTEFLGLNQWEGSDAVLHTDFNEDNYKVDEAVQALHQLSDATAASLAVLTEKEAVDYEFLSFALLNALTLTSLESYYPGDKQGLIYDSFVGAGKAMPLPEGLHVLTDVRCLGMGKAIDAANTGTLTYQPYHTAYANQPWQFFFNQNRCGYLKSFTVYSDFSANATVTINIRKADKAHTQAGEQVSTETITRNYAGSLQQQKFTFTPVYLTPGDYVIELIPTKSITLTRPLHSFVYDSCARASSLFTSVVFPFSNFRGGEVKARVTHDTGTVSVTLIGSDGTRLPMSLSGTGAGISQAGEISIVSEYALADSRSLGESVQMELDLSSPATLGMRVFDYGIVFL